MKWQDLPPLVLYPRLIPHVTKLCLKYRSSLAVITNANPAFPFGGLPFADKKPMFDLFDEFLPYTLIKTNDSTQKKLTDAKKFLKSTSYPIIAKPNLSHRGIDINLIKNEEELKQLLNNQQWDYLLQEYCTDPVEAGIFYCKLPHQQKGTIVSMTNKIIPILIGNGKDPIKTLIENSAIENKPAVLEKCKDKLDLVLKKGEQYKTLVAAAHSKGAMFYNANNLITKELTNKIQELCDIEGFNFGRFDVKAKSYEELKQGKFKIIEVNGATSEFIHIYDNTLTFKQGITDLKRQWSYLFEISHHHKNKQSSITMRQFISEYLKFFWKTKKVTGIWW